MLLSILVIILVLGQIVALFSTLHGTNRLGGIIGLLSPLFIMCIGIINGMSWSFLSSFEVTFLSLNGASFFASFVLFQREWRPLWLFWAVWFGNSLACAIMVYLAFFFRLF